MVALSASRLVCPAMSAISVTTSPMRTAASASAPMRRSVRSACATACSASLRASCTCRLISPTAAAISSVAEATDCTLEDACSDAPATLPASCWVVSALRVSTAAAVSSSVEAEDTVLTILPMLPSKASARPRMSARLSSRWRSSSRAFSERKAAASVRLSLKAAKAADKSPISSLRSTTGTSVSSLPAARLCIAAVIRESGRAMERTSRSRPRR